MRVALLHAPGDLRLEDFAMPTPESGMSLVRVAAVGICGSDLHFWDNPHLGAAKFPRPLVLGHEAAGVVIDGPQRGKRVAIDPAIPDGTCPQCLAGYQNLCPQVRFAGTRAYDGALAEVLAWPSAHLVALPDRLSDSEGAVLEPLGVAIHALDLGHVRIGTAAAVIGCGPVGLLLVQLLRAMGVSSVAVDPLSHRREAARHWGALVAADSSCAEDPPALRDLVGGGVDTAFEFAGSDQAVQLAMRITRPGGRVVLGGIPGDDWIRFPASVAQNKGLTIATVRRMNQVYPRAIALATSGHLDLAGLVTGHFSLSRAAEAFDVATKREGLKVLIQPAE